MIITIVAGARPNFMKIKPIIDALIVEGFKDIKLVHTGQHYDKNMSQDFFNELELPKPDINLNVKGGSQASQTANIMLKFEKYLIGNPTDLLIVVGDVNSTLACSLVATKMGIKIAHVEAGLRSGNWAMPEEVNRVLTDHMSDYLFTTSKHANTNLKNEGISNKKVFFVGNVMIDTLLKNKNKIKTSKIFSELSLKSRDYILFTLHRPSNVDNKDTLNANMVFCKEISEIITVVFTIHPRTKSSLKKMNLWSELENNKNIILLNALGYLDFVSIMSEAKLVITDSGGIQEETTVLGIPCITLRDETERPETVELGTNRIVGNDFDLAKELVSEFLSSNVKYSTPPLWDGKSSKRIAKTFYKIFKS